MKGKRYAVKFQCENCKEERQIFVYGEEVEAVRERHDIKKDEKER